MRAAANRIVLAVFAGLGALALGCQSAAVDTEIINVSYDPTRELYQDINDAFTRHYEQATGKVVHVTQSHGGSGAQARAVRDGLRADVVTLALASDIDALAQGALLPQDWQTRLPNDSCPFTSTIVFVVRKGNPKNIRDWPDLIRPGVKVITPNPKTSGGARWNFLAAWGFVTVQQQKPETDACDFVARLYGNVPKLDTGARGATDTFLHRRQGDVLIAWENEAILAQRESRWEEVELAYPSVSIRADPPAALLDRYADERGTRTVAEAYLQFLYSDDAQALAAKHGFRPSRPLKTDEADPFPALRLFTIRDLSAGWGEAQQKFFADGGIFDQAYQRKEAN
jgi:sulfate transport system substrate-binding protein